ncbi:MAG: hypothetical protein HRU01_05710 [Myxococcales bacterium]|nr:hypothetical protein [Myxococcales bacterium]
MTAASKPGVLPFFEPAVPFPFRAEAFAESPDLALPFAFVARATFSLGVVLIFF